MGRSSGVTTAASNNVKSRPRLSEVNLPKAVTKTCAETKHATPRPFHEPAMEDSDRYLIPTTELPPLSPMVDDLLTNINVPSNKRGIPVFAMLPLDTVNTEGRFKYHRSQWFHEALDVLVSSGVTGVAVDVWWGVVEKHPREYNWNGYRDLFDLIASKNLRVQVVMSFHACGDNVGDVVQIPLPEWVLECGRMDPDIFLSDRPRRDRCGHRNREYLSIFAEEIPLLYGRSPMQCYADFMVAFRDVFEPMLGTLITEVVIGAGPCGELRYPSYSEANGWRFPGVGEFQCYDRHALSSLARAAIEAGHPEWGYGGPHNSGEYNDCPNDASFFTGSWNTDYGHFFLQWYSDALLQHGRRLLTTADRVFAAKQRRKFVPKPSEFLTCGLGAWFTKTGSRLCRSPSTSTTTEIIMSEGSITASVRTNSPTGMLRDTSLESVVERSLSSNSLELDSNACPDFNVFDAVTGTHIPIQMHPQDFNLENAPVWTSSSSNDDRSTTFSDRPRLRGEFFRRIFTKNQSEDRNLHLLQLSLKIAGVHWWYGTRSHAAELTAGYNNAGDHCGYEPIVQLCREFNVGLTLTCVEMCDAQHSPETCCSPQGLLKQIRRASAKAGVRLSGENALPLFFPHDHVDICGLERIVRNCHGTSTGLDVASHGMQNNAPLLQLPEMQGFTFLRLGPEIVRPRHRELWNHFMKQMKEPRGPMYICTP